MLEERAREAGANEDEWKHFIAYCGTFFCMHSNYVSAGGSKFVPNLSKERFISILRSNPLHNDIKSDYREVLDELWPQVETEVFAYETPYKSISFPEHGGVTGYFSRNMTSEDLKLVKEFLMDQGISILNTRAFKFEDRIVITVGSISSDGSKSGIDFKG